MSSEFTPSGRAPSPAAQHVGTERLGATEVPSNSAMERDGPPASAAPPDPGLRDIRQGESPPRDSREDGVLVQSDP
eukprot:3849359-Rhodomonas_salina.1